MYVCKDSAAPAHARTRAHRPAAPICLSAYVEGGSRLDEGAPGEVQRAAAALGLVEGETVWYIF